MKQEHENSTNNAERKDFKKDFDRVQGEIYEILANQKEPRLIEKELTAVVEGYTDYLLRTGWSIEEIWIWLLELDFKGLMPKSVVA